MRESDTCMIDQSYIQVVTISLCCCLLFDRDQRDSIVIFTLSTLYLAIPNFMVPRDKGLIDRECCLPAFLSFPTIVCTLRKTILYCSNIF